MVGSALGWPEQYLAWQDSILAGLDSIWLGQNYLDRPGGAEYLFIFVLMLV
jgi:hypothetical protein